MKARKWFQRIDGILMAEMAVIGIMLIPVFIISFYTILSTDDFGNIFAVRTALQNHRFYISAALSEVVYYYKNVSGYFFAVFMNFYISPFLRGGIGGLRVTTFLINLFFYVALYFFVDEMLKFFYNIRKLKEILFVYVLILFAYINCEYHTEMTTWYCTLVGYVLVVVCSFWGITFCLKAMRSGKVGYVVASSVLGFLASGGALNVTALNCGMYLLAAYFGCKVYQKRKIAIICFASALAGGIINAVAPGNFIRHGTDVYPSFFKTLSLANYHVKQEIQELLFYSPFILVLCIFFVFMLIMIRDPRPIKGWHLAVSGGIVILGAAIVNFPVCLGYMENYFPDRCIWVQNFVIYFGAFGWTACLAEWIKGKFCELEIKKEVVICLCISSIFYVCNLCAIRDPSDYPTVGMIKQIASGEIAVYADYWEDVLEEIEHSDDRDVVVTREEFRSNDFIKDPDISTDREYETNVAIAQCYGKDSVCIVIGAEE